MTINKDDDASFFLDLALSHEKLITRNCSSLYAMSVSPGNSHRVATHLEPIPGTETHRESP